MLYTDMKQICAILPISSVFVFARAIVPSLEADADVVHVAIARVSAHSAISTVKVRLVKVQWIISIEEQVPIIYTTTYLPVLWNVEYQLHFDFKGQFHCFFLRVGVRKYRNLSGKGQENSSKRLLW